jgi:hypothetical protein
MVTTPEEFMLVGEYIEGRHYFDTEYEVFAEQQGRETRGKILMTPAENSE